MEIEKKQSPVKSSEDIQRENRHKIAQKFLWGALSVIGIIILLVAVLVICTSEGKCIKKSEAEKIAINALRLKTDQSSLKVLEVSDPDSVFINRLCPEYELMDLSERFLQYSLQIMQDSQEGFFGKENTAYQCMMNRYSETSNALNTLNSMLEKPQGEHCGWRVKVKYNSVDDSKTPYTSEAWFIFDKDQKHILNSFDISVL